MTWWEIRRWLYLRLTWSGRYERRLADRYNRMLDEWREELRKPGVLDEMKRRARERSKARD